MSCVVLCRALPMTFGAHAPRLANVALYLCFVEVYLLLYICPVVTLYQKEKVGYICGVMALAFCVICVWDSIQGCDSLFLCFSCLCCVVVYVVLCQCMLSCVDVCSSFVTRN